MYPWRTLALLSTVVWRHLHCKHQKDEVCFSNIRYLHDRVLQLGWFSQGLFCSQWSKIHPFRALFISPMLGWHITCKETWIEFSILYYLLYWWMHIFRQLSPTIGTCATARLSDHKRDRKHVGHESLSASKNPLVLVDPSADAEKFLAFLPDAVSQQVNPSSLFREQIQTEEETHLTHS